MKKVFFVGKNPSGESRERFSELGRELGRHAAERGYSLIVGSDSESTLDLAVVEGAGEFARATGRDVAWEVVETSDGIRRFSAPPDGLRAPLRHRSSSSSGYRWEHAHLEGVLRADAVVAMGGSDNTHRATRAAMERGVALLPIPHFGGAAANAFDQLLKDADKFAVPAVQHRWLTEVRSTPLASLAGRVSGALDAFLKHVGRRRRVYFISYSTTNQGAADEVEMFLRRHERGVMRDETAFVAGTSLRVAARQAIESSDDFIVLDSVNAAASVSVDAEIAHANRLRRISKSRLKRVVGVLLEGPPPKTTLSTSRLHLRGASRLERELAVERLVQQEHLSPVRRRP